MKAVVLAVILLSLIMVSCRKNSFTTAADARLSVSTDTLYFDTLFTSTGSVTQFFRIYNNNEQKLRISNVQVSGGNASAFKINADGSAGPSVKDIEIEANDSIYVFVSVKIDPGAGNLPFVMRDSVSIDYNGNRHWVQLEAWGQNAHFIRSRRITGNEIWTNDKPYVILGGALVDTNASLTIEKGCRIYFHANAPLIVDGTLKVNGEWYDSTRVLFRGDRLDDPYRDYPGGWPGILFRRNSHDNVLRYADIGNAYQAIAVDEPSLNASPKVLLDACIINNAYDAGIIASHSSITAQNCLISNCGKNVLLTYGGNYNFIHCTDVAVSNANILHKEPVLLLANYKGGGNALQTAGLQANFTNCIFWSDFGTVDDEVVTSKQGNTAFNANFQNCLWKAKKPPANVTQTNIIVNQDPLFDSVNTRKKYYSFHLKAGSPAIDKGIITGLTTDLDGHQRNNGLPDLGCYEK